mmetsp:Transcript_29864/g.68193  ORF Transcript_29864/g.68193 Transcript_29864/m.68193 type:complete len:200 (-) Transcript_29864:1280-1879(-)
MRFLCGRRAHGLLHPVSRLALLCPKPNSPNLLPRSCGAVLPDRTVLFSASSQSFLVANDSYIPPPSSAFDIVSKGSSGGCSSSLWGSAGLRFLFPPPSPSHFRLGSVSRMGSPGALHVANGSSSSSGLGSSWQSSSSSSSSFSSRRLNLSGTKISSSFGTIPNCCSTSSVSSCCPAVPPSISSASPNAIDSLLTLLVDR